MDYQSYSEKLESAKRVSARGVEYWMARDIQPLLGYGSWDKFDGVVQRAVEAAESGKIEVAKHFSRSGKMVKIGSGAERERGDWYLTRGACYLIAMNADSSKEEVGHAMVYFATQTRRQEIRDNAALDGERLRLRLRLIDNNKKLTGAAKNAGVINYGLFQDAGYQGLYEMGLARVKERKGLSQTDDLLDHAGELELSANDLRAKLTEHRLNRNNIRTESGAISTHKATAADVRSVIVKENGVKPEDLPVEPTIKPLVQKHQRQLKKAAKQITESPKDDPSIA